MSGTREPVTNAADTFGKEEPVLLPCHVDVVRDRDGRYRVWAYFAGRAFAVDESTADLRLAQDKAFSFRHALAQAGANVSGLVSMPEVRR